MPTSSASGRGAAGQKGHGGPDGRQARDTAEHDGMSMPPMPPLHMPRVHVPGGTAGNVLWWGGLAAVAAFGIVDWPIAALVAAGTWVAEQHAKQSSHAHAD